MNHDAYVARELIVRIVLRLVAAERDEPNAYYAAEIEYCDDELDKAALELVRAGADDDVRRGRIFEVLRSYSHDPELTELVPRLLEAAR